MTALAFVGIVTTATWSGVTDGTFALTVTPPSGTISPSSPAFASGAATATFTPTVAGRHQLLWTKDSTTEAFADIIDVWPSAPRYLVSYADAVRRIQQDASASVGATNFDSLMLYVAAATGAIEDMVGPLLPKEATTKSVSPYPRSSVLIPTHDVEVTEVTFDDVAQSTDAYVVDDEAGVVHIDIPARTKVEITYTAGGTTIPPNARLACLEIVAHLWQVTMQGGRPLGQDVSFTPTGFAIPKRAAELLAGVGLPGGAA